MIIAVINNKYYHYYTNNIFSIMMGVNCGEIRTLNHFKDVVFLCYLNWNFTDNCISTIEALNNVKHNDKYLIVFCGYIELS